MKLLIASDIHGSAYWACKLANKIEEEKPDRVLLLGDILYHGPRNDLPKDYNPKKVIEILNAMADRIICVRGNCDSEVDQMVLNFPIMADYTLIELSNKTIFATHGHIYSRENLPKLKKGDYLLNGHFHVPEITDMGEYVYLNPGSVSIPKGGSANSYMLYDGSEFFIKEL